MNRSHVVSSLGALLLVGACSDAPSCTGDWCGTVVVGVSGNLGSLFPPSADSNIENALVDLLFVKLADVGPGLNTVGDSGFVPELASSWTWMNPTTLRLTLNPAARWHDGAPVTADDVAFTFDVYRDTLVAAPAAHRLDWIASMTPEDPHTVVVRFRHSYAEALFDAVYHMRILPKHLLDSVPRRSLTSSVFARHPIGAGPYRFVRWEAGQSVELAADSAYFLGRPGIPRIVWRFTPESPTLITQLLAGEIDIVEFLGGPSTIHRVETAPHLRVLRYPAMSYGYVDFNLRDPKNLARPHPLFGDRALRRALSMAIDRKAVVEAILGPDAQPPSGPLTRAYSVWTDSIRPTAFDSARARTALERLGWLDSDGDGVRDRNGHKLAFELLVPSSSGARLHSAEVIQEQLRRVGVEMRIASLDFETTFARAREGQFDAVFGSYGGDPSPMSIAEVWTARGLGSFNYGHYVPPELEQMVVRARGAAQPAESRRLWQAVIARILTDAPAVFVYEPPTAAGIHERLENVTMRPDQWAATLWTWRVAPDRRIDRDRYGVN